MSPLCSLNVNRLLPLLLLLPTRAWVQSPLPPPPCSLLLPGQLLRLPSASHFIVNVRIWSAHCAVAYIAIIIIMLRLIPHPIQVYHPPSLLSTLTVFRTCYIHLSQRTFQHLRTFSGMGWGGERETVLGRGSDDDGQGFPHTPNILSHTHTHSHAHIYLSIYSIRVCLSVCLQRVHGKSLCSKVLTHRSSAATSLKMSLAYQLDWTRTWTVKPPTGE